jgi:hypothetical protein
MWDTRQLLQIPGDTPSVADASVNDDPVLGPIDVDYEAISSWMGASKAKGRSGTLRGSWVHGYS